jgi:hypothetical protein
VTTVIVGTLLATLRRPRRHSAQKKAARYGALAGFISGAAGKCACDAVFSQPSCDAPVVLYEHERLGGKCKGFDLGAYNSHELGDLDKQTSSLTVAPAFKVILYSGETGTGQALQIDGGPGERGAQCNDCVRSLIVWKDDVPTVTLFENGNATGQSIVLSTGEYTNIALGNGVSAVVTSPNAEALLENDSFVDPATWTSVGALNDRIKTVSVVKK